MENIIITGATGIVGSQVVYDLLAEKLLGGRACNLHLVIRPKENTPAENRLDEILQKSILPQKLAGIPIPKLRENLHVISGSFDEAIIPESLGDDLIVLHIAASVNLGKSEKAKQDIIQNNYHATHRFVENLGDRIGKLVYASTAFACGVQQGVVKDDYSSLDKETTEHRNYYEAYKFKSERDIRLMADRFGFELTIARPSVICGRLIEENKYVILRYIVFYMFGKFLKYFPNKTEHFRLVANEGGNVNIVPVDYVSQAIVRLIKLDVPEVNIVSTQSLPNSFVLSEIMRIGGLTSHEFVQEIPSIKSSLEEFYYKIAGGQFTTYITEKSYAFDSTLIRHIMQDIPEPDVQAEFSAMYQFAHDNDFENRY